MKSKIHKILGVVLTLVLLGSLTAGMAVPTAAAPEAWTVLPTPAPGVLGSYLMGAAGGAAAGPGPMEKAIDGTLYAYWNSGAGEPDNLYKSADGGHTWSRCSAPTDDLMGGVIVAIACSTQDADRLYVTDGTDVYKSIDAGANFTRLVAPGIGANITCMDVGYNGDHFVYIGTTAGGGGDVLVLRDAFGYGWGSTGFAAVTPGAGVRTVRAVACSPNFTTEANPQVIAISYDTGTNVAYFNCSYGGAAWETGALPDKSLDADPVTAGVQPFAAALTFADIAFPSDYNSAVPARDFFVGVTTAGTEGGVYRVVGFTTIRMLGAAGAGIDITSVAVAGASGSCKLLAAGADAVVGANVYRSDDNGINWLPSDKDIACVFNTNKYLIMDDDYFTSGKAWIATRMAAPLDEASVAGTTNFGQNWTDLSLINTDADQIFNMEVSPEHASDGTVFIVTGVSLLGNMDSVWKGSGTAAPNGTYWTRVATIPFGSAATAMVRISPDNAVFLANAAAPQVFWSPDGGTCFIPQTTPPVSITGGMIAINSTTLIVGDGGNASISTNNGTTWTQVAVTGATAPLVSFAISPDGGTLLLGDSGGGVFMSTDGGFNWVPVLPGVATPGGGFLSVIFDADYTNNNTIYAADATSNAVYRAVLGTDTQWRRIDGAAAVTWPGASTAGAALNGNRFVPGIQAAPDGALYVADAAAVAGGLALGDAFTVLDPTGADWGLISVTGGAVTITNISGLPAPAGTYAAPFSIPWAAGAPNDAFSVTAAAPGTTGTWLVNAVTTSVGISNDADGDASVIPSAWLVTGTFSLPDAAGVAGAAAARAMLRSVNPTASTTSPFGVYFEPLNTAFTPAAAPAGVWYTPGSNTLFTLASAAGGASAVWTYEDNLTVAPTLSSPADGTDTGRTTTAMLTWDALPNCPRYEIWVAPNPDFAPVIIDDFSTTPSYMAGGLDDGITYYWKVCSAASNAAQAGRALSPWSEAWTFTTGIGAAEWNPFSDAENVAPAPGATGVAVSPAFQWNPADWATGYEFVLADNPDFTSPLAEETVTTPVYLYTGTLSYSTTYYWKVRAVSATSESVWATGTFTTMAAPVPEPTPTQQVITVEQPEITPAWIWAIVIIGAILVIAVIVLIVTTRRVP